MSAPHSFHSVLQSLQEASVLNSRQDGILAASSRELYATPLVTASKSSGDPTIADVIAQLKAASAGPDTEVEQGNAPLPQNIGILPAYDKEHALKSYDYLMEISSLAALYTALFSAAARTKRGHPEPYRITDAKEAAQAFADMADCAYTVMSNPLAGFYNFSSGTSHNYDKTLSKTGLHLEFLKELFEGFSLSKPALLQLDSILTKFISSLSNVTVETQSSSSTVDYTLRVNQVMRLNVSGDEANPVYVFQPRTRLVFMHIDSTSYSWATNKASHQDSQFKMQYRVADFDLNVNRFLSSRKKLDEVFEKLSGMSMKAFGEKINPDPVQESQ